MRGRLQIFNADGSMNRDPLGENEEDDGPMGRWMGKKNPKPDICKHGNHATSLKNLELQFCGSVAITPCPVCLAALRKDTE